MNFKENESEQKLRGGYYTPPVVAQFLARWALSEETKSILEPSCGDGRFIEAIEDTLPNQNIKSAFFDCLEVLEEEAVKARQKAKNLSKKGIESKVTHTDFFEWITNGKAKNTWDVVLGNPPYIRYQYFDSIQRDKAERLFREAHIPFTKRTNAWVPFVIASIMHLAPGGRLAMVVPAELLHIQHAEGLRLLLEQEMESVAIINIRDMIFAPCETQASAESSWALVLLGLVDIVTFLLIFR